MAIIIGSARHDEHGNCYKNGSAGDQLQTNNSMDMGGEVSMQQFYVHTKGWYVLRFKEAKYARLLASLIKAACNNPCIGYDQNQNTGILKYGIYTKINTECDCGTLMREGIKEATGTDVGVFNTATEKAVLSKSSLFEEPIPYTSSTKLYTGDILVTKTKGHTAAIVEGANTRGSEIKKKPVVASGNPVIKKGSKGIQVKYLQQDLNYLGYTDKNKKVLSVDGDCGDKTIYALISFQKANELKEDGKYGPKSEEKMISKIG
jgi:hypothetical protein